MQTVCIILLVAGSLAVSATPLSPRIVGGSITTINQYPFAVSLLYSSNLVSYNQVCGGTILTTRSILTAAHCVYGYSPSNWRARVGSSWANSAGTVYTINKLIIHGSFNPYLLDNDVAIVQTTSSIAYSTSVKPASIAGSSYFLGDNQQVWAIGWGATSDGGPGSEQLRHVQIWTVNQNTCKSRYSELAKTVTENMVCSGWLDVGGRDQCQGDAGGPLIHNNVVVGISSWGQSCGLPRYPGVNTRVSKFTTWIQANA